MRLHVELGKFITTEIGSHAAWWGFAGRKPANTSRNSFISVWQSIQNSRCSKSSSVKFRFPFVYSHSCIAGTCGFSSAILSWTQGFHETHHASGPGAGKQRALAVAQTPAVGNVDCYRAEDAES